MSRLYMSADGDGRPDRAWMAAFVRVLISRFREVWRLPFASSVVFVVACSASDLAQVFQLVAPGAPG